METIKNCYANFDFDVRLADQHFGKNITPTSRYNKHLQYLFLWFAEKNEALIHPSLDHFDFYQDKITQIKGHCPPLTNNKENVHYWWGGSHGEEEWKKEKLINSKKTSYDIEKKLGLYEDSFWLEEETPLPCIDLSNIVCKKEHGFSGQMMKKDIKHLNKPFILEERKKRIEDYSTIVSEDSIHMCRSLVNRDFQYVGSLIEPDIEEHIFESVLYQKTIRDIFKEYQQRYSIQSLQIDSFLYEEQHGLKWRYLCEVNHRFSMGQLARKIHKEFRAEYSIFFILPKKNMAQDKEDISSVRVLKDEGILQLSHPQEDLQCYFVFGRTKSIWLNSVASFCQHIKHRDTLNLIQASLAIDTETSFYGRAQKVL